MAEPKPEMTPRLLHLQARLKSMTSALLDRQKFANRAGITFDGRRDFYEQLGYPRKLEFKDYMDRYQRGGIAERICDAFPRATWAGGASIEEDPDPETETKFEKAVFELFDRLDIWARFLRADILAGIGRYSVIFIGVKEPRTGDNLLEPFAKEMPRLKSQEDILFLTPIPEDRATILEWEEDTTSPRCGLPKFYSLKIKDNIVRKTHWSRVLHVAPDLLEDEVFGRPRLRACWNYLDDLDKIIGGGAEAAWKRMDPGLQLDLDPELELTKEEEAALRDEVDEYQHGVRRIMKTRGVKMNVLSASAQGFGANADSIIQLIAATSGTPHRILTGSERGELASSQDRDNWGDRIAERRREFAVPLVGRFVDRCIEYGALPEPEWYEVVWPETDELDEQGKAAMASTLAAANGAQVAAGDTPIMTSNEIRQDVFGLDPLPAPPPPPEPDPNAVVPPTDPNAPPTQVPPAPPEKKASPAAPAAELAANSGLLSVLEAAIVAGNTEVIHSIIGLGGPGSGNFGHAGRKGEVGGSAPDDDEDGIGADPKVVAKKVANQVLGKLRNDENVSRVDPIRESKRGGGSYYIMVRDFGEWEHAPDRRDEEDDDHKVPTAATAARLDRIVGQLMDDNSGLLVEWQAEEKNWISVYVAPEKSRALGGPGSGNFGHSGRKGEVGGSAPDDEDGVGDSNAAMKDRVAHDVAKELFSKITRDENVSMIDKIEKNDRSGGYEFMVRDFGEWEHTPERRNEEDDDHKVPTQATADRLDRIVGQMQDDNSGLIVDWQNQEKNWISFHVSVAGGKQDWRNKKTQDHRRQLRQLGGPGSGNFGHSGRPGEVGGSSSDGGAAAGSDGAWKSKGGWKDTGIEWKQETDPATGRPIPIKVKTVDEAAALVLEGKVVEVEDVKTAYTLIDRLAQIANEAKAAGAEAKDYDLCQVSVAGTNMFCTESLRTAEYPNGVPRIEMPQLGGKPVPGSEADKLERNPFSPDEVDGSKQFITHLQGLGIRTSAESVPAADLRASQRELVGSKVAKMVTAKFDPGKEPIFVSRDNYVVDGHHRWAAVVARDAEDGRLGDSAMNIVRVNAPISEVLRIANAWSKSFGIQQKAGNKKS